MESQKRMSLWILSNYRNDGSDASFQNLLAPFRISRDTNARPKKGEDKIGAYVEAAVHFLKSYAANAIIAKAPSEIGQW